mmetsp:Transcript_15242/g.25076  ORF Transcript_15242/g.25076 Transcript_15242/m.25076 type:complete len:401 (-) Transcript_15242:7-1209(-)
MTVKCKPASLVGMLLIVSIKGTSAFQQCRPSSQNVVIRRSGASHYHRRRKNTCCAIVSSSALLQSSSFDDFDDFDDFDSFGEWDNRQQQQQQRQYNDNQWDVVDIMDNRAAQFPPPPPYDRPPYSSNLRKTIASSTPSPYDNPSWTKSSRYGNRNVNFNSRSNRNVNTFIRNSENDDDTYDPYQRTFGYGRETYRNSAPKPDYEYNYQSQYKGYPSRTTYSQDDNYAGRRRWEDSNTVFGSKKKKLYRDYDDVDNDPNSSRGKGGADRLFNSNNNGMNNSYDFQRPPRPPQYRDYDDPSDAPNRSYREDSSGRTNGLPPPPQYRDYDDINTEPNRSYRDDVGSSSSNGSGGRFPPRPSQYRDYDDVNSAPSRSYRREGTGYDSGNGSNNSNSSSIFHRLQ